MAMDIYCISMKEYNKIFCTFSKLADFVYIFTRHFVTIRKTASFRCYSVHSADVRPGIGIFRRNQFKQIIKEVVL